MSIDQFTDDLGSLSDLRLALGCKFMVDDSTNAVSIVDIKSGRGKPNTVKITYNGDQCVVSFYKINQRKYAFKKVSECIVDRAELKCVVANALGVAL